MIYPRCIMFYQQSIAINYQGYVVPCCLFLAPENFDNLISLLGDKISQLHYTNGSIESILKSEASNIIRQSFFSNPMHTCKSSCEKPPGKDTTPAGGKVIRITPI
jgi:hypothetical protein